MTLQPNDNVIHIGGKPTLVYVKAISTQFLKQQAQQLIVKSRGRNNARALDVVQISLDVFLKNKVRVVNVITNSEYPVIEGKSVRMTVLSVVMERI